MRVYDHTDIRLDEYFENYAETRFCIEQDMSRQIENRRLKTPFLFERKLLEYNINLQCLFIKRHSHLHFSQQFLATI